jgi:hypothetical protein
MSVAKRILEANQFSKILPDSWKSTEPSFLSKMYAKQNSERLSQYVVDAPPIQSLAQEEMYKKLQELKPKSKPIWADKNQQSLF